MNVLWSDLRKVSLGCQVVSHEVVTDAGRVVTASAEVVKGDRDVVIGCQEVVTAPGDVVKVATGVVTGCEEVTTEFREPSIEEGVDSKGNTRNLIWRLFQENPDASYSEVAEKIGVSRQAVRASVMRMRREGREKGESLGVFTRWLFEDLLRINIVIEILGKKNSFP